MKLYIYTMVWVLLTCLGFQQRVFGQINSIDISVVVSPPYTQRMESYFDEPNKLLFTATNTAFRTQRVRFQLILTGKNNGVSLITNESFVPPVPVELVPDETRQFTSEDLESMGVQINLGDITTTGLSDNDRDNLINNRILPDGEYDICLRALQYDSDNPIFISEGCDNFQVASPEIPIIIQPMNEEVIEANDIYQVNFSWTLPSVVLEPEVQNRIEYTLKVVDLTESGLPNAYEGVFDPGTPVVFETETQESFYQMEDIPLIEGNVYAVRVTAKDPDGEVAFQSFGHSEPVTFTYGEGNGDCQNPNFETLAAYPQANDTIPFNGFPLIIQFKPYCDNFNYIRMDMKVKDSTNAIFDEGIRDNNWPNGALTYLKSIFPNATEFEASHLVTNKNQDKVYTRGAKYNWSVDTEIRNSTNTYTHNLNTDFHIGMPRPKVIQPINGDTVQAGQVTLRWHTGQAPQKILPPFPIVTSQRETDNIPDFNPFPVVKEKYVLQLSRNEDFSEVLAVVDQAMLNYNPESDPLTSEGRYDDTGIKAAIYLNKQTNTEVNDLGDYYWRVLYLRDPEYNGDLNTITQEHYYRSSPTGHFRIVEGSDGGDDPSENEEKDCDTGCELDSIQEDTLISTLSPSDTILFIGHFQIIDLEVASNGSGVFNGTGKIPIPFLNNLKIRVNLHNIKINKDKRVFAGYAEGRVDDPSQNLVLPEPFNSLAGSALSSFDQYVRAGRVANSLIQGTEIGLPVALDLDIQDVSFLGGITKMDFHPKRASIQLLVSVNFPAPNSANGAENWVAMAASDLCILPSGFGKEFLLHLHQDLSFYQDGELALVMKGIDGDNEIIKDNASYIQIDCEGVKSAAFRAEAHFSGRRIVPEDQEGNPTDGVVKGYFELKYDRHNPEDSIPKNASEEDENLLREARTRNWMVSYTMDNFQIRGLEGWGFEVNEGYFDWSSLENPPGLVFPEGYEHPTTGASNPNITNLWTGFFLKSVALRTPKKFMKNNTRATIAIENLILDPKFSANIKVYDLIKTYEGQIDDWAFSLDTFYVDFVQNDFVRGGLNGKIGIPFMESGEYLAYDGILSERTVDSNEYYDFVFHLDPTDDIVIPAMLAEATIAEDSFIEVVLGRATSSGSSEDNIERASYIEAKLNGKISISSDLANRVPTSFSLPGINYGMHFRSGQGFLVAPTFSFTSPKKTLGGFPLDIEDMSLDWEGNTLKLLITPRLSIIGESNGFSFSTKLSINSTLNLEGDGQRFKFDGVDLEGISVDTLNIAGISISGGLEWYGRDESDIGDEGLKGILKVGLPTGASAYLATEFGNRKLVAEADYGTSDYFGYWFADGLVNFGNTGVPITAGFGLYGFGGGFAYNMERNGAINGFQASSANQTEEQPNPPNTVLPSGFSYSPKWNNRDFNIKAVMGTYPSPKAFNMDVGLYAGWTSGGGLTNLSITGDGYFMTSISERGGENEKLKVEVRFNLERNPALDQRTIHGRVSTFLNLTKIKGAGSNNKMVDALFHAQNYGGDDGEGYWYFHLGRPRGFGEPGQLKMDLGIAEVNAEGYFMIGHQIPDQLPAPPPFIQELLGIQNVGSGQNALEDAKLINSSGGGDRVDGSKELYEGGNGFATGVQFITETKVKAAFIYAQLKAAIGMDINISQNSDRYCFVSESTKITPGKNGWYGIGQIYAGLKGEVGIEVKLIKRRKFHILSLGAAVMLSGGMPNPFWAEGRVGVRYSVMGGAITGRKHFSPSIGEKCIPQGGSPFVGINVIDEISPGNLEDDVSVFVDPKVSFSIPIDQVLEVPIIQTIDGRDEVVVTKIKPVLSQMTLIDELGETQSGNWEFEEDNLTCSFKPNKMLAGRADDNSRKPKYTFRVVITADEFINGRWQAIRDSETGGYWQEDSTITFNTGKLPDQIPKTQILYSVPIDKQRFFLTGEPSNASGKVSFVRVLDQYFPDINSEGDSLGYFIRIQSVDSSEVIAEIPLSAEYLRRNRYFSFDMPELESSTLYGVQVISEITKAKLPKLVTPYLLKDVRFAGQTEAIASEMVESGEPVKFYNNFSREYTQANDSKISFDTKAEIVSLATNKQAGLSVKPNEKKLYEFHFRTSEYVTLMEKMDGSELIRNGNRLILSLKEAVDIFDVQGYQFEGRNILEPRIEIYDPLNSDYYREVANPYVYEFFKLEHPLRALNSNIFQFFENSSPLPLEGWTYDYKLYTFDGGIVGALKENGVLRRQANINNTPTLKLPSQLNLPIGFLSSTKYRLNHLILDGRYILDQLSDQEIGVDLTSGIAQQLNVPLYANNTVVAANMSASRAMFNPSSGASSYQAYVASNTNIPSSTDTNQFSLPDGPYIQVNYNPASKIIEDAQVLRDWAASVWSYQVRFISGNASIYVYPYKEALSRHYPEFLGYYRGLNQNWNIISNGASSFPQFNFGVKYNSSVGENRFSSGTGREFIFNY